MICLLSSAYLARQACFLYNVYEDEHAFFCTSRKISLLCTALFAGLVMLFRDFSKISNYPISPKRTAFSAFLTRLAFV